MLECLYVFQTLLGFSESMASFKHHKLEMLPKGKNKENPLTLRPERIQETGRHQNC